MSTNSEDRYACILERNAARINEAHAKVKQLAKIRDTGSVYGMRAWSDAVRDFREAHDSLAFPGGYEDAIRRLRENDPETIDIALSFLEIRPYFFRSQYMRKQLTRLLKKAALNDTQQQRFTKVRNEFYKYRFLRSARRLAGQA